MWIYLAGGVCVCAHACLGVCVCVRVLGVGGVVTQYIPC